MAASAIVTISVAALTAAAAQAVSQVDSRLGHRRDGIGADPNPRPPCRCADGGPQRAASLGSALDRSRRLRRSAEQSSHYLQSKRVIGVEHRTNRWHPGDQPMSTQIVECTLARQRPRGDTNTTSPSGQAPPGAAGRVPRIARLMALALRFERLVRSGAVRDYAALA